jgi:hypothetical protein
MVATVAAVLLKYDPSQNDFYPRCPVYELFHLQCPGCGATRALAALLRGHLAEALHWNALFTVLLPFGLAYGMYGYGCWMRGRKMRWAQPPGAAVVCGILITAIFGILRNVPGMGF